MNQHDEPNLSIKIEEKLGEGSYGKVYRCMYSTDGGTPRNAVVKKVPIGSNYDEMQSIVKEISILKHVRHPNIVTYFNTLKYQDEIWVVMEYCTCSLSDLTRQLGPFKPIQIKYLQVITKSILLGLEHLHEMSYVHRDVKAANILLCQTGVPKIADFGISSFVDQDAKRTTMVGSPYWLAPEVISGEGYDIKADVWSLGITLIEIVEGRPPLSSYNPMRVILMIPRSDPPSLRDPEPWEAYEEAYGFLDFLRLCLTKDQAERPSVPELLKHRFVSGVNLERDYVMIKELLDIYREKRDKIESQQESEESDSSTGTELDEAEESSTSYESGSFDYTYSEYSGDDSEPTKARLTETHSKIDFKKNPDAKLGVFHKLSPKQLRELWEYYESKKNMEIEAVRRKYAPFEEKLEQVLSEKRGGRK